MIRWRSLPFALVLVLAGCEKKSDPTASARLFFEQVAAGQGQAAYQSAAFGFQAQRNPTVFQAAAREMGMMDYAEGEWGQPEMDGRTAKIPVHFKSRDGKDISLAVTMIKESGAWRVFALRIPPANGAGVSENRFTLVGATPTWTDDRGRVRNEGFRKLGALQPVPSEAEMRRLVRETLLRFNDAVVTKSFDAFYDSVSVAWQTGSLTQEQNKLTKGQLQRAFQGFIDQKINIAGIEKVEPIWDSAATVGTDGMLLLSGYYPTDPVRVHFSMRFTYEVPEWKLFGLDVNLRK